MPVKANLNGGKRMPSYREGNVYWASIALRLGDKIGIIDKQTLRVVKSEIAKMILQ